jgi:hypothetical protein
MSRVHPSRLLAGAFFLLLAGCGGPPTGPDVESLQALAELYAQYAAAHKGQTPPNDAELRKFAASIEAQARAAGEPPVNPADPKVTRFDKFFTSTRDGQPFVVRYGTPVSYKTAPDQVLATEAIGVGGKKLAVYSNGLVVERSADAEP